MSSSFRRSLLLQRSISITTPRQRTLLRSSAIRWPQRCFLSEQARGPRESDDGGAHQGPQPFVNTRLDAGEWDPQRTNPLYRPKFRSTAKILHADDFANRPKVGFSGEFENYHDAMVTLSHMGQSEQKEIYEAYHNLMISTETQAAGRTSHEYAMRVLAQKFHITAERVAAVVLLQHNEQQLLAKGVELCDDVADVMDQKVRSQIKEAYSTTGEKPPSQFCEDPVGVDGSSRPSKKYTVADDLLDLETMTEAMQVRERDRARLIIDGHVYKEDLDDEAVVLPMDKVTKRLLRQRETIAKKMAREDEIVQRQRQLGNAVEPAWKTTNGKGESRPRWRYVAQIVDTRQLKKAKHQKRLKKYTKSFKRKQHENLSYINNSPENTLVEEAGVLRPGSLADCKTVSWKPQRDESGLDHLLDPMRRAYLDRTVRNQVSAWGKAPVVVAAAPASGDDKKEEKKQDGEEADAASGVEATTEEDKSASSGGGGSTGAVDTKEDAGSNSGSSSSDESGSDSSSSDESDNDDDSTTNDGPPDDSSDESTKPKEDGNEGDEKK